METLNNCSLTFLGGVGTVTGSKYLLRAGEHTLLVDCGMFQGKKELRQRNWEPLSVDASTIDLVLLTHGHLDHCSYLPKLVKEGFQGLVLGTAPTLELAEIIVHDSAKIMEEEAEQANKEGYSKHAPALPLYTLKDTERAIKLFRVAEEGEWIDLFEGVQVRFMYNGHIIGACFIELDLWGKRLVFSGDVGRPKDVLLRPYKKPDKADVLVLETTYGDSIHSVESVSETLKKLVLETIDFKGTLLIPSFAIERTQSMMYLLYLLQKNGEIPEIPMYMDSPMGTKVLSVFTRHLSWHTLSYDVCKEMCDSFRLVSDYSETWEVIDSKGPKIVIAGSGMLTGGRILTYLQQYLDKSHTTVLLTGYQAEQTRGRALLEGEKSIKIRGKYYLVNARIKNLEVLSAHADQGELIDWISEIDQAPSQVFLVHGEPDVSKVFQEVLLSKKSWTATLPIPEQSVLLF